MRRCFAKGPLAHGRLEYALALLVPLATLSVTFALRGVYPFGDLSVCVDDMDLQLNQIGRASCRERV